MEQSPLIANMSTSLATMWDGAVVKLRVNESDSVRRIPIYRLLHENDKQQPEEENNTESTNKEEKTVPEKNLLPSYKKLRHYAIFYSDVAEKLQKQMNNGRDSSEGSPLLPAKDELFDVKMTYTDEEGDKVDFSSDEELSETIFFLKETQRKDGEGFDLVRKEEAEEAAEEDTDDAANHNNNTKHTYVLHVHAIVRYKKAVAQRSEGPLFPLFASVKRKSENGQRRRPKKDSAHPPKQQQRACDIDPFANNPIFNALDTFFSAVVRAVDDIKDYPKNPEHPRAAVTTKTSANGPTKATSKNVLDEFDPNFIHWRHACDGCLLSPIVGYRYHSTTIPNFDLCHSCMMKCDIPNVAFKLAQYKPDRSFRYVNHIRQASLWGNILPNRSRGSKTTPAKTKPATAANASETQFNSGEIDNAIKQSLDELKKQHEEEGRPKETPPEESLKREDGAMHDNNKEESGVANDLEVFEESDDPSTLLVEKKSNTSSDNDVSSDVNTELFSSAVVDISENKDESANPVIEAHENVASAVSTDIFTKGEPKKPDPDHVAATLSNDMFSSAVSSVNSSDVISLSEDELEHIEKPTSDKAPEEVESIISMDETSLDLCSEMEGSVQDSDSISENSDDWDVVDEDIRETDDQIFALATEIVGSALYQDGKKQNSS